MTINQPLTKTFLIIVSFVIFHFAFSSHVNAQEIYASNYTAQISIDKNTNANVIITIDLNNDQSTELAGGYSIVLPFAEVFDISTTLNSQPVNNHIKDTSGIKTLEVDFGGQTIKPSSRSNIQIVFNVKNAIKQTDFGSHDLYIPELIPNHRVDNFSLRINFDKSFGKPQFITSYKTEVKDSGNNYSIEFNEKKGIYAIWAEKVKLSGSNKLTILNVKDHSINTLVNIIPFTGAQKVAYTQINNVDSSIYDQLGNYFFNISLEPNAEKEISYNFNLEIDSTQIENLKFMENDTKIDSSTRIGNEILSQIASNTQTKDQLYNANNLIKQRIDTNISSQTFLKNYKNDLWEKLSKEEKLTDLEFSLLSLSIAEYLNLPSRINYGFLINDYFSNLDTTKPHTWVEVQVGDEVIIIDPFLEKLTGLEYFGIKHKLDRITMGTWHPEEKYNNLLGLLESDIQRKMSLKKLEKTSIPTTSVGVNFILPDTANSGFNFTGELRITNNTLFALPLEKVLINDKEFTKQLEINRTFLPLILPTQTYITNIRGIREDNFFDVRTKEYEVRIEFDNVSFKSVSSSDHLQLELSGYTIAGVCAIGTGILTFGMIVNIRRKMKRRHRSRNS